MRRGSLATILTLALAPAVFVLGWLGAAHLRYVRFHRRIGRKLAPLRPGDAVRYYLETLVGVARSLTWRVTARHDAGWRVPREVTGPPVVCVHGFLMNHTALTGLRRRLEARGRPTRSVYLGSPRRSIDGYLPALEAVLEEAVARFPDQRIDLVAHSMGGLVCRRLVALRPDLASRVRRVVTLGTPHRGTPVSRSLPVGPEVLQMAPGSPFLGALPTFAESAPEATIFTVAADPDLVVYPREAAHLEGAEQIDLPGVSHLGLVTDPRAIETVVGLLTRAG